MQVTIICEEKATSKQQQQLHWSPGMSITYGEQAQKEPKVSSFLLLSLLLSSLPRALLAWLLILHHQR